jgi:hypothetical protein
MKRCVAVTIRVGLVGHLIMLVRDASSGWTSLDDSMPVMYHTAMIIPLQMRSEEEESSALQWTTINDRNTQRTTNRSSRHTPCSILNPEAHELFRYD